MTGGPGPRVAALLGLVRPLAAEVVVALDDRADAATETAIASVADLVIRYPYHDYNRTLPWLFSCCENEWILNLDSDEIPGSALLEKLPSLTAAADVTHYWLLRRWLWPDANHSIAEHPWTTDYQLRLVRNDPRLLRFPSETHLPICVLGPHRFVREPLYHADTILSSLEHRVAKAQEYEVLRPGKRVGGGPMNHIFYLPEHRQGLRTEPLPEADAALVQAVLSATASGWGAPLAAVSAAADDEVDRLWAGRSLSDDDRKASLKWLDTPERMMTGEHRAFDLQVGNRGGAIWPWGKHAEPGVRLAFQWLDKDGELLVSGSWSTLPADLAPGETQVVPLHVDGPPRSGRYRLRVDLIQEHVGWFGAPIECDVEVTPRLRVALSGTDEAVARTLLQLAEEAPEFEPLVVSSERTPRFGPPQSPDLRAYLFDGTLHGHLHDFAVLATRTWSLVRAARSMATGVPARPLLRGAQPFLEELGACSHLLLVGETDRFGTREIWLQFGVVAAARELGVDVVIQRGATARPHRLLDRLLLRNLLRQTRIVEPGVLGLE